MNHELLIFQLSGIQAQTSLAHLLSGIDGLVVEPSSSGPDFFLMVESASTEQAEMVKAFVLASDPHATNIHRSSGATFTAV
jgi:hypothetical protein